MYWIWKHMQPTQLQIALCTVKYIWNDIFWQSKTKTEYQLTTPTVNVTMTVHVYIHHSTTADNPQKHKIHKGII